MFPPPCLRETNETKISALLDATRPDHTLNSAGKVGGPVLQNRGLGQLDDVLLASVGLRLLLFPLLVHVACLFHLRLKINQKAHLIGLVSLYPRLRGKLGYSLDIGVNDVHHLVQGLRSVHILHVRDREVDRPLRLEVANIAIVKDKRAGLGVDLGPAR